jgi:zinc transport system permease protein
MIEFFSDLPKYAFLQYALWAGLLAGISSGIVGTFVVTRRISYLAGGIAHSVLGGMGAAQYLNTVHGWAWLHPLHGAIFSGLLAALIIGIVSLNARQREDTVIGAIWALGMAIGILFISKTPGYDQNLMSYLFGNILMVSPTELYWILGLDAVVVLLGILFYNPLVAVCFDEQYAALRGLNVKAFYLLLLCMTALTVVLLVTVVGIVLVIALLTIPVALAGLFSKTLWRMMLLSILFSVSFTTFGLAISYGPDLPAGATIILVAGIAYLAGMVIEKLIRFFKKKAFVIGFPEPDA